jgi:hypothetical protein
MPGFISSGCTAGSRTDARCVACPRGLAPEGALTYTDGCNFECNAHFWMNGTTCAACSALRCPPGFHPSACTPTADSTCVPCASPGGRFNWTSGCGFACAAGFFASNGRCQECVVPTCAPGSYPSPCRANASSICLACAPPPGNYSWLGGGEQCQFACAAGWYRAGAGCVRCSQPTCAPGAFPGRCGATHDATCLNCSGGGPGVVWTSGCDFVCQPGAYWLSDGAVCRPCSTGLQCDVGWYASACTATSDSVCARCAVVPNSVATVGCDYACNAGYYLAADRSCATCSQPACVPGRFALPCNRTADASCAPCSIPTPARSVRWTGGCAYACASGYYAEGALCIACNNAVQCPPGFTQSECVAGRDTQCVPCANFQAGYQWTNGCDFVCAPGYYQRDTACIPCSPSACAPGTYAINCSAFADTFCIGCPAPVGAYAWTDGCAFQCAPGRFLSGMICVQCSAPACAPGRYASNCTATTDSVCVNCPRPVHSVGLVWTAGCQFRCTAGYYTAAGSGCLPCSTPPVCAPGTFLVPCSANANARCAPCQGGPGVVWTAGCAFTCLRGFYRHNSTCRACSTNLTCAPGFFPTACAATADAVCSACGPPLGVGAAYTAGCAFVCRAGYYARNGTCRACSAISGCPDGYSLAPCTNVSDAACRACSPPTEGAFVWRGCEFECAPGFVLYDATRCLAIEDTETFVEVTATLAVDNAVAQVCADLFALLEALSAALVAFGEGPSAFVTEAVALDGRPCVSSACPQCDAARRLLLASGVSLVTSSPSSTPFNLSTPLTPASLTTVLRSTLPHSTLQPRVVEVSLEKVYKPKPPAPIEEEAMHSLWHHHGELLFLMLGFASVGLLLALHARRFFRRRTREVLVPDREFEGVRLPPPNRRRI